MDIIIAPFDQQKNGKVHPKHYPYWQAVVELLKDDYHLIQLGIPGDEQYCEDFRILNLVEIEELLKQSSTFITVDSFLHHLAHRIGVSGVVIFGISDPLLFSYPEHVNLLKDRKYLRVRQFGLWTEDEHDPEVFVGPDEVVEAVSKIMEEA